MGSNLALNIAEKGHRIAVFNRTPARTDAFVEHAGALEGQDRAVLQTLDELAAAIRPPRPIIIMVKAGKPVDEQIDSLRRVLSDGDIVIDAGNANFRDTMRRFSELSGSGLTFIGMGVSGGEEGARHGPSIMVGGTQGSCDRVENVLTADRRQVQRRAVLRLARRRRRRPFRQDHPQRHRICRHADDRRDLRRHARRPRHGAEGRSADVFERWNKGRLNSYLIEITAKVLAADDPKTGKPVVDIILDRAGQKGTGRWSVIEAQTLGVPATAIEAAVAARVLSSMKDERAGGEKAYGAACRKVAPRRARRACCADLELALLAGKIAAYAQGFAVMARRLGGVRLGPAAADDRQDLARRLHHPLAVPRQDRGGLRAGGDRSTNLLMAPAFIGDDEGGACRAAAHRGAAPSEPGCRCRRSSSALAYFDSYRQGRGTSNLIQAQRDFFGAHGFERIDAAGAHHGPWAAA